MDTCSTPYCDRFVSFGGSSKSSTPRFCNQCKMQHSYRVLIAQSEHGMSIKDVIMDASTFKSVEGMGAYIGVSFVTMYQWIRKYFNMSFQEFRRNYICKSEKCYLLDIRRSSYSRDEYVIKKLRSKRYCACLNALERNFIMTNAPVNVVQGILRGRPRIDQISDRLFALVPSPVYFKDTMFPVYFDLIDTVLMESTTSKGRKKEEVLVNERQEIN